MSDHIQQILWNIDQIEVILLRLCHKQYTDKMDITFKSEHCKISTGVYSRHSSLKSIVFQIVRQTVTHNSIYKW